MDLMREKILLKTLAGAGNSTAETTLLQNLSF